MHCNTYCGRACSETYGRAMATNKQSQIDKINIVEETEVELEELVREKIGDEHLNAVQNIVSSIDTGYSNFEVEKWCRWIYFPTPMTHQKMLSQEILWWMSLDSYESAVDAQMIDAREIEIETCAYKDCGYLFVDIQCHYWQFHPQFIKPNTNQANLTNEKVTEKKLPEVQEAHKESNQSEGTESVKAANHQPEKQGISSDHTDDLPIKEEQKPPTETEMCKPDSNSVWSAGVEHRDIPESKEEEDGDIKNEDGGSNQSEDTEPVKPTSHQPEKQGNLSDHTDDLPIKEEQKPPTETEMCKTDSNSVWSAGTEALSPTKADNGLASGVEQHDIPESKEEEDGDIKNEDGGAESQSNKKGEKEFPKRIEVVISMSKHMTNLDSLNSSRMTSNGSVVKTDIKYETHRSYDKTNLTRVDIEELTDKKEERTNYLEDKDSVAEIKPPESTSGPQGIQPVGRNRICKSSKSSTRKTRYFK